MATTPDPNASTGGYLGSGYPVPTDPNSYLNAAGLGSLLPQAFNQQTLAGLFAPQSLQYTPYGSLATDPFLKLFMQGNEQATKLQHRMNPDEIAQQQAQQSLGAS